MNRLLSIAAAAVFLASVVTLALWNGGTTKHLAAPPPSTTTSTEATTTAAPSTTTTSTTTSTTVAHHSTLAPSTTTTAAAPPRTAPERWAYVEANDLLAVDLDAGKVTDPFKGQATIAVAPDRAHVAINASDPGANSYSISVADAGATAPHRVSDPGLDHFEFTPSWSPDGKMVAFASQPPAAQGNGGFEIVVVNANGTGRRQVTTGANVRIEAPSSNLAWSPDQGTIAFLTNQGNGGDQLDKVDVATGKITPVTQGTDGYYDLDWLPDGTALVATSTNGVVVRIAADGSGVKPITPAGEYTSASALSPDGKTIAYEGAKAIKLVAVNGGPTKVLVPAVSNFLVPPVWSSDGTALLFETSTPGGSATDYVRVADAKVTTVHEGSDFAAVW